ncbi:MAG TPA: response regulator, partial [Terracidiphilus sp.]|nr:response regulator [Terracidiphilus sp.]
MAPGRPTRILIVDDSAVMRSLLRSVVSAGEDLEVAGTAADGVSALSSIDAVRPDLILLDVEMAGMDGLTTLRALRKRGHKMPVIMCSSLTQRGAKVTLEALACGASDYVAKPAGQANREAAIRALGQDLFPKIHALTSQFQPPNPVPFQALNQRPGGGLFQGQPQSIFQDGARAPRFLPLTQLHRPQAISSNPTVLAIGVS